jgi:hypothetical protein
LRAAGIATIVWLIGGVLKELASLTALILEEAFLFPFCHFGSPLGENILNGLIQFLQQTRKQKWMFFIDVYRA